MIEQNLFMHYLGLQNGAGFDVFDRREKKNLFLLSLLGKKHCLDVGQDTTLSDGDSGEKLVQFLIVTDCKLQMTGNDTGLLVVACGVAGKLKDLSGQVFHDCSQVHGCSCSDTLCIVALPQETMDTTHRELKASPT